VQPLEMKDGRSFKVIELCEIPENLGAEPLGVYGHDFYAGLPCLAKNAFGKGQAYYLAAKLEQAGLDAIYADIASELNLEKALPGALPEGVIATARGSAVFLQNFSGKAQTVALDGRYTDLLTGDVHDGSAALGVNGIMVLQK